MRIVGYALLVGGLLIAPALGEAANNEAKKPEDGGSRLLRLFPAEGVQHLPGEALEHGAAHAVPNVSKDPRSDTADQAVGSHQPQQ